MMLKLVLTKLLILFAMIGICYADASKYKLDALPKPSAKKPDLTKPIKVFILSGQSNMVGMGNRPSLEKIVKEKKMFQNLLDDKGNWVTRKDVQYLYNLGNPTFPKDLSVDANGKKIGPELQFGHYMGYIHDEPVLVIKACNGNRCLGYDVLPPSRRSKDKYSDPKWPLGKEYDAWFRRYCKKTLRNLHNVFPGYQGQGYEIAGFGWWQGFKDIGNSEWNKEYEQNLVALIKDLRKDFNVPNAPFVVATVAFGGMAMKGPTLSIHQAQMAVSDFTKYPEFKGNVASVDTRSFYRGGGAHYGDNSETYMLVGEGMGKAMSKLILNQPKDQKRNIIYPEKEAAQAKYQPPPNTKKPIKVYFMSGQSNMVGMGSMGSLESLVLDEKKYTHLADDVGNWIRRNDVYFVDITNSPIKSYLSPGLMKGKFGPELQFGHVMGDHHDEVVLVIKIAQGNRSIGFDVMPPSSRVGVAKEGPFYRGWQYDIFIRDAKKILSNIKEYYPDYEGQGYEIEGFCWWQGFKDNGISKRFYERHLVNLINDFRNDLDAPNAKFVVATVAFGGKGMSGGFLDILKAQMAITDYEKYPHFKNLVAGVDCRDTYVSGGSHYGGHATTYVGVGDKLGKTMVKLINKEEIIYKDDYKLKPIKRTLKQPKDKPVAQIKPVKVYVMLGQSNMVGLGAVGSPKPGDENSPGDLGDVIQRKKMFTNLVDENHSWIIRRDVRFVDLTNNRNVKWLRVGVMGYDDRLGPEVQFGFLMGDYHDEPVVIIKAAQGNRSLGFDLLSPSSRKSMAKNGTFYPGWQYDIFVANIHKTLKNLKEYYPDYGGQGYEVAGFCWWQGHKDAGSTERSYQQKLINMISDLRKEFNAPNAPFSIASIGFHGKRMNRKDMPTWKAQMGMNDYKKFPDHEGNVMCENTRPFWRDVQHSPRDEPEHYNRNGETYSLVGNALGVNMIKMLDYKKSKKGK